MRELEPWAGRRVLDDEARKALRMIQKAGDRVESIRGINKTETNCLFHFMMRSKDELFRAGWPDFLAHDTANGKIFGVEVKSPSDVVSQRQALMFVALSITGIQVYIWNPDAPKIITKWEPYTRQRCPKTWAWLMKQQRSSAVRKWAAKQKQAVHRKAAA